MKRRLAAVFGSRQRSSQSDVASSQCDDASPANDDSPHDDPYQPKQAPLARPKSSFFRSLSRRAQPPAGPLITVDGDHPPSSSSSSSAGPSTPDDDARSFVRAKTWLYQTDVAPPTQTAVHVQVEHDSDDESSSSEFSRGSAHTPTVLSSRSRVSQQAMPTPTSHAAPTKPLSAVDYAKALANNGLSHPFSPPPLLHIPNSPLFPRSCNAHSQVSSLASDSLRTQLLQKRVLARLSRPSRADERVLLPFAGRHHPQPKGPHLLLDDSAVSGRVCARSEGLWRWVDRPCFEDRLVVYRPVEEGEGCESDMEGIVRVPVSGTLLGVAALEFSEHLEDLAGLYDDLTEDTTVTADTETDAATEVTFTLTTSPTVEPPKTQDIPVSIEFPRRSSQDVHAAPALNVDVDLGGLGDLIDFEPKLSTDSSPAQLTPPLSLTASSASPSPTSSGPPTPTVTVSTGAVAGNAPDVKESVKGDAGSRTPSSSPQQPPGILSSPQQRQQPYKATPSPLRIESNMRLPNPYPRTKPASISGSSTSSTSPTPSTSTSTATVTLQTTSPQAQQKPSPRPAVRFAPSTKGKDTDESTSESEASEDERQKRKESIPLGYVQRVKQQRLEKQRFLAAERARRAQADEAQHRAAQAKAEEEARLRAERRREEEERRRRMYQEEVIAARSRRESTKFVPPQLSMSGSAMDVAMGAGAATSAIMAGRGREREKAEMYARPVYDQRRGSESSQARSSVSRTRDGSRDPPPVPPLPLPSSPSVRNASPAPSGSASGSQRDSSAHSHLAPPHPAALAPGTRSSSAPDVRPRDRSASSSRGAANRSSIADGSIGGRDRTSSSPSPNALSPPQMWMTNPMMGMSPNMNMNMGMNMNRMSMMGVPMMAVPMAVPVPVPVHGYPMSPMQMGMEPLLPPTPPFVMQQFGYRPQSQNSHRDSSQGGGQRRSHSSSPTPPPQHLHSRERSEPRSQSSSPTAARQQKASFPPSSGGSAVRASHYPPPSPSSSRQQDYSHHRRSSADMDLHHRSNLQAPPVTASRSERGEHSRDRHDRDDRRASKVPPVPSPSSRSSRPQPYHSSSMPSPASSSSPPAIVVDRTSRPVSGFQILSRPAQQRRQTIIS